MRIAILYSEIAEYSLACFQALKEKGCQVQLIHWPVNPEAPFQFDLSFLDAAVSRAELDRQGLLGWVKNFDPHLILCSGWMDKDYLAVCRKMKGSSLNVLSLDNHWTGSPKQWLAAAVAPFTIKRTFQKAFVPGVQQSQYAERLGFAPENIQLGFYSADTYKFNAFYSAITPSKRNHFPKRFLYLGRYVRHKGIFELWEAFAQFHKHHPEWELWCVGTGDQFQNRMEGPGIKHFGFVQPDAMLPILMETGVYILPSHVEPWGVSVHEMAVAGFPMLLSDAIGAREAFLQPDVNGKVFGANSTQALLSAMEWIAEKPEAELQKMAETSHQLGMQNSPARWAERLMALLPQK